MSFARIRAPGMWLDTSVVEDTEFEQFDLNISRAVDGFAGGTYAPSAAIILGGSGLQMTGAFVANGAFTVNSNALFTENVTVSETLAVNSFIDLNGGLDVSGDASFHGNVALGDTGGDNITVNGQLACLASVTVSGTLSVNGAVTLGDAAGDNIIVAGTLFANAPAFFNADVTLGTDAGDILTVNSSVAFNSAVELRDPTTLIGNGHIVYRVVAGADANTTYGINDADVIHASGLGADRVYTLSTTGATTGARITFVNETVTFQVTCGGTPLRTSTGFARSVTFVFLGGAWRTETLAYTP